MRIVKFKKLRGPKEPGKFYYYFRARADNGEIIAQSEGYTTKRARDKTVRLIRRTDWTVVPVIEAGEAEL